MLRVIFILLNYYIDVKFFTMMSFIAHFSDIITVDKTEVYSRRSQAAQSIIQVFNFSTFARACARSYTVRI